MFMKLTERRLAVVALALVAFATPAVTHAQAADDGAALPDYSRKGADTCFQCHEDQAVLAIFRTKHAVPQDPDSPFGHGQLQCEACHGPAGDHAGRVRRGQERPAIPAFGFNSTSSIAEQNANCVECHDADTGFAWHGSAHDDNTVGCSDCHTMHTERDPVLSTSTQAEVCFDCHQQQRTQAMKPYAHPVRQGKMACTSCHSPHGDTPERLLAGNSVNGTCYDCHAELRGPYLWEHAPATEDCNACHDPHGSTQPGMLSMRAPMLCQSCHSQDGHPSLPQDARGLANNVPSPLLLGQSCLNCHDQVHGSNHPSGSKLMR